MATRKYKVKKIIIDYNNPLTINKIEAVKLKKAKYEVYIQKTFFCFKWWRYRATFCFDPKASLNNVIESNY